MDGVKVTIFDYDLLIEGKRRYYKENLFERDFTLENTTPYLLNVKGYEIIETTWVEMICSLSTYLILNGDKTDDELLRYRTMWSKSDIFCTEKRINFKRIKDGLYINCNHTALHSCWFIQDLLEFFKINIEDVEFYIHRPSSTEPLIVKKYFIEKKHKEFELFLTEVKNKTDDQSKKIISNMDYYLNIFLKKTSKSYDNVFLFDDVLTATNYIAKIKEFISKQDGISEKNKIVFDRYCSYLLEFYKI